MTESLTTTDIAVYGATAAGAMAAVAAKRENPDLQVTLIEPGQHVGGMLSGGLSFTDLGDPKTVGGLAREFYDRTEQHYGGRIVDDFAGPEPHVAESILRQMLEESEVDVSFGERLTGLQKEAGRISCLRMATGNSYKAQVCIDASYEGSMLPEAGIPYRIGRDGTSAYGEDPVFAGRQGLAPGKHNFIGLAGSTLISPFREDGILLPGIRRASLAEQGSPGSGDGGVMAYQFRLCGTQNPDNQVPFEAPDGYNPDDYELLFRLAQKLGDSATAGDFIGLIPNVPGSKADFNSVGPFSLNKLDGENWEFPDASYDSQQQIRASHLRYVQGFCYALANDQRVPKDVREQFRQWGLAKDEFADTDHWPHQFYIREGRRMLGKYVLTQHDIHPGLPLTADPPMTRQHEDAVLMGSYNIDIREVQRTWQVLLEFDNQPYVMNEGYLSRPVKPYQIPYRCFTPKDEDCSNLLVPVCASMSHVAFASYRMETPYMMAGHAVGTAAAMAVSSAMPVQEVGAVGSPSLKQLQQKLVAGGQVIAS